MIQKANTSTKATTYPARSIVSTSSMGFITGIRAVGVKVSEKRGSSVATQRTSPTGKVELAISLSVLMYVQNA